MFPRDQCCVVLIKKSLIVLFVLSSLFFSHILKNLLSIYKKAVFFTYKKYTTFPGQNIECIFRAIQDAALLKLHVFI